MNLLSSPLHSRGKEFYGISEFRQSHEGEERERERERVQVQFGSLCVKEKPEEDFFARRSEM